MKHCHFATVNKNVKRNIYYKYNFKCFELLAFLITDVLYSSAFYSAIPSFAFAQPIMVASAGVFPTEEPTSLPFAIHS